MVENKGTKRTGKLVRRILLSLVIFIALDLSAGLFLVRDNLQSFRTEHHYYHHGLIPNREALAAWGPLVYPYRTNSMGLVDSAVYQVQPTTGKVRILILGDSHSEGVGVPYLKTFAGRLATEMQKEDVEVLNASCISYSQKIEYLKLKYLLEEEGLQLDHVFLLVDISDMQNELVYRGYKPAENSLFKKAGIRIRSFLQKHSAVYSLSHTMIQQKETDAFFDQARLFADSGRQDVQTNTLELYSTFFSHFDDNTLLSNPRFHGVSEWYYDEEFRALADTGIQLGQTHVSRIKSMCDERGIELTVSVHPWQTQIIRGDTADYYTRRWETWCHKNDIRFLNLFPVFINGENALVVNRRYYIKNDNHWNEFGHERVADTLVHYFNTHVLKSNRP